MSNDLFKTGGPLDIRKLGGDRFSASIPLPEDEMGMTARECPNDACSSGLFKIKFGTGVEEEQSEAFCPYCHHPAAPNDFTTKEQWKYAENVVLGEASKGVDEMIKNTLGLDARGKKNFGGDLISMEMSYKPSRPRSVPRPLEDQFRRDVACPNCTLEHAVYGLAVWCPDCGSDIFITHVEAEANVVRLMLGDVDRRGRELGSRVAASDIENCLEDVVSIQEASMKAMARRKLVDDGNGDTEIDDIFRRRIRNRFQGIDGAIEVLEQVFDTDIAATIDSNILETLKQTLEKRHPITHNLGITDKKYIERVQANEEEGRDVYLDEQEVQTAMDTVVQLIRQIHADWFDA